MNPSQSATIPIDPSLLALTSFPTASQPVPNMGSANPNTGDTSDGSQNSISIQVPSLSGPVRTLRSKDLTGGVKMKSRDPYLKLRKDTLQEKCRNFGLVETGTKEKLVERLPSSPATDPPRTVHTSESINISHIYQEVRELENSFVDGYRDNMEGIEEETDNESESEDENGDKDQLSPAFTDEQVDGVIFSTRCKAGQQTEKSTIKQWETWVTSAISDGKVPDNIVDANHRIQYLSYAATRKLLTRKGSPKAGNDRLSHLRHPLYDADDVDAYTWLDKDRTWPDSRDEDKDWGDDDLGSTSGDSTINMGHN
ncbi:hypothetical protein K435DRAFT_863584 [Dendrothele bispora CBS 962.96]|uniref:SAP domain-containing protein n=1 Tax=Dendrothele bispora (strain CBS 962.96) TaxID=1314807 RepID=A0A4S8LPY4_DENBC|nr:hypothetical protein K435DRAFT_863584 [Dendrothele bispora CBS 962.96]